MTVTWSSYSCYIYIKFFLQNLKSALTSTTLPYVTLRARKFYTIVCNSIKVWFFIVCHSCQPAITFHVNHALYSNNYHKCPPPKRGRGRRPCDFMRVALLKQHRGKASKLFRLKTTTRKVQKSRALIKRIQKKGHLKRYCLFTKHSILANRIILSFLWHFSIRKE